METVNYKSVLDAIRECNDLNILRVALMDTLENAKNSQELAEELVDCHGLGERYPDSGVES